MNDILDIPINIPVNTDIKSLGLNNGQSLLLKHWQRTNNVGDCNTISTWGNMPGQWTYNTRARLAQEIYYIKHWKFQKISNIYGSNVTWFIDPPYQYNYKYKKIIDINYIDLAIQVNNLIKNNTQVIVCEAVGKLGEIPNYLPFQYSHNSVTSRRKINQSHHSKELIFIGN
jgi:16S rRNA G966 N2-methylase RsmD